MSLAKANLYNVRCFNSQSDVIRVSLLATGKGKKHSDWEHDLVLNLNCLLILFVAVALT